MTDQLDSLIRSAFPPTEMPAGATARVIAATLDRVHHTRPAPMPIRRQVLDVLLRYAMPMAAAALCAVVWGGALVPAPAQQTGSLLDGYTTLSAGYR